MTTALSSPRSAASFIVLAAALLLGSAITSPADAARRHLSLVKSAPMADSVVDSATSAVRLWFSEPVELGVTRVRLTAADAKPVALAALTIERDGKDPVVTAAIPASLAVGTYTVNWSTASKDGHVVRGSFGFTVRTP